MSHSRSACGAGVAAFTSPACVAGSEFGERVLGGSNVREYVWLECTESGQRNYRTPKETRGTERLELKKYCKKLRKHTIHKESRKK